VLAVPEVFIQLNCLNFLRRYSQKENHNYSYLKAFNVSTEAVKANVNLCLDRLRHDFMCWADTGLNFYSTQWDQAAGKVVRKGMDFGTLHYCRNFDVITSWTSDNGVRDVLMDEDKWADLL
jgi:hypothetical protein